MEQTSYTQSQPQKSNKPADKWSFAAFFGTWVWLFVNKQTKLGIKFLLFWIVLIFLNTAPWLGIARFVDISSETQALQLVWLGVSVWLGIKGRDIVWQSGVWQTPEIYEQQQKRASKWVVGYGVFLLVASPVFFGFILKPYIDNPGLLDERIREEMLQEARSGNPSLNTTEFNEGYSAGVSDGAITNMTPKTNATKTSSYQDGYRYGYMVSCIKEHNDEVYCLKQTLQAP